MHLAQEDIEVALYLCRSSRGQSCAWWCSRQSCARAGCGASLQRSHCVSTALRCALSRLQRGTRCVRFALCARTTAMRMLTKRAARAAVKAVFLGAAQAHRSPPGHTFAKGWFVVGAKKPKCPQFWAPVTLIDAGPNTQNIDSRAPVPGSCADEKTKSLQSRKSVPGGGDLCGGEEASPGHKQSGGLFVPGEQQGLWPGAACKARAGVGARSALRQHSHRGCPNGESAANKVSSAVPTPARAPQRSRHAVRPPQCEPLPGTDFRDASSLKESACTQMPANTRCLPMERRQIRATRDAQEPLTCANSP
jgi:hypothetical protein